MSTTAIHGRNRTGRSRRWSIYAAVALVAIVGLAAVAGETYEELSRTRDERDFRRWGDLVDVGGYRLNLNCLGHGVPTVVLDSGLGLPGAEWSLVQPDIAEFAQVCSYDRAGYGWSNSGPFPRTSEQIALELHTLLQKAGINPPYILVGHSFGGHNMRVYAHRYPDEVAGIVLVEAAHEDQMDRLPERFRESDQQQLRSLHRWQPFMPVMIHLGVQRLVLQEQPLQGVPSDVSREIRYLQLSSKAFDAVLGEMDAMPQSIEEVRNSGSLDKKPLLVLTAANAGSDLPPQFDRGEFRKIWITELQAGLARLSMRGQQVIVPDTGHLIPLQQPQAVVDSVRQMVSSLRHK